jgi:hypothetical protein
MAREAGLRIVPRLLDVGRVGASAAASADADAFAFARPNAATDTITRADAAVDRCWRLT